MLIQHLSHSEQHLYSWPFEGSSNYILLHMQTHRYAVTPHTRTHTHTNHSPCSDITPHHWFLPNLQPPPWEITQSLSSHQGVKYTPLKSNRGGWRDRAVGVVRGQEVAGSKCEIWRWKMRGEFSEENAKRNVCVCDCSGGSGGRC